VLADANKEGEVRELRAEGSVVLETNEEIPLGVSW
jgi:hypothetical protein